MLNARRPQGDLVGNITNPQPVGMDIFSGYFVEFKDGPKVLLWGDILGLRELASLLRASAACREPLPLDLFVQRTDGRSILIRIVPKSEGMIAVGTYFEWRLDTETVAEFAEMVDVLAEAKSPVHQYLESFGGGGIPVMVSCGEYPPNLRP